MGSIKIAGWRSEGIDLAVSLLESGEAARPGIANPLLATRSSSFPLRIARALPRDHPWPRLVLSRSVEADPRPAGIACASLILACALLPRQQPDCAFEMTPTRAAVAVSHSEQEGTSANSICGLEASDTARYRSMAVEDRPTRR
jgi:hypothetical protein